MTLITKILQVCPTYYPQFGGVEEHVQKISERLARKFEVTVATTDPSGELPKEEVINDVQVRRFKSWAPNAAYYFSGQLMAYLARNSRSFHLIHAHGYHSLPALYAALTKGPNSFVFTSHYHGTGHTFVRSMFHIPYKSVGRQIFEKADAVVCVSRHEMALVLERFRIDRRKITVIPNGIDPREFEKIARNSKDPRVVLYVGRLEEYKGIDHLIEVLPRLHDDMRLEVVGTGPHASALAQLAEKVRVKDRVRFYGDLPREQLLRKYAQAGVFVSLSRHEAFGIGVAEALAAGTACIVANTSALQEWIDNKNCFGIDLPVKIPQLAHVITTVSGRTVCPVHLTTWDDVVERLIRLYEELRDESEHDPSRGGESRRLSGGVGTLPR